MNAGLQTDRLSLAALSEEHLQDYFNLIRKPEVYQYLSRATEIAQDPWTQAQRIVGMSEGHWRERGYGPFAVFTTSAGQFIGRAGFFYVQHGGGVEVNYMLDPATWGRGYATEILAKLIEVAFGELEFERLVATTSPLNVASRRVLEKQGFRLIGVEELSGGRSVELHELLADARPD